MKYLLATSSLPLMAIANPAVAQDSYEGLYVSAQAGLAFVEETQVNVNSVDDLFRADHETGYEIAIVAGYDFGKFRIEGDVSYSDVGTPSITDNTADVTIPTGGQIKTFSVLANALVDFGSENGLQFSAGGGIGVMSLDNFATVDTPGGPLAIADDNDSSFAWQLIGEVRYPVSNTLDLGVRYRFKRAEFDTVDPLGGDQVNFTDTFHSALATATFNF